MKYVRILTTLLFVFIACSAFTMKEKGKGMYLVGVSASFTDSLIYFTDIQFIEGVELDKNKLLPMRSQYSDQLEFYLEEKLGLTNRTCFVYFNKNKDKISKQIKKMKDKYQKDGKSILKEIGEAFKFTKAVEY